MISSAPSPYTPVVDRDVIYKSTKLSEKIDIASTLELELGFVVACDKKWLVTLNTSKTKLMSVNLFRELSCYGLLNFDSAIPSDFLALRFF